MEYTQLACYKHVSRMGFGCWAIGGHGWGKVDEKESIAAIRYAYDQGINLFDTADVYGFGHSETILAKSLERNRKKAVIATKFGVRWDENGKICKDISPGYMRKALEDSLRRLKIECIPLYYIHWPDQKTELETIIPAMVKCIEQGKIGALGISNFSSQQIESASKIAPIHCLQTKLNILETEAIEEILPICNRRNISFITWGSLADGLLTGKFKKTSIFKEDDHRRRNPILQGAKFKYYLKIVDILKKTAMDMNVSIAQLSLRWLLDTPGVNTVLVGAKTKSQIRENIGALKWKLKKDEYSSLCQISDLTKNYIQ